MVHSLVGTGLGADQEKRLEHGRFNALARRSFPSPLVIVVKPDRNALFSCGTRPPPWLFNRALVVSLREAPNETVDRPP